MRSVDKHSFIREKKNVPLAQVRLQKYLAPYLQSSHTELVSLCCKPIPILKPHELRSILLKTLYLNIGSFY